MFQGAVPRSHKRGFEEHDLRFPAQAFPSTQAMLEVSWNQWFPEMTEIFSHFANDSFSHSFGKADETKSFTRSTAWLTCCVFRQAVWLLVSPSNRHIVKRAVIGSLAFFLHWLLEMTLDFESSVRKELYKKYEKCPKCLILKENIVQLLLRSKRKDKMPNSIQDLNTTCL